LGVAIVMLDKERAAKGASMFSAGAYSSPEKQQFKWNCECPPIAMPHRPGSAEATP
jgi:hypothetical protein